MSERVRSEYSARSRRRGHYSAMVDVAAHMLLLRHQALLECERPADESFAPLSLTIAALLRQLPSGLAPPAGMLSLHEIDCLPVDALETTLARLVYGETVGEMPVHGSATLGRALGFVRAIAMYAKTTRALLAICHDHITNQRSAEDATQAVVEYVVKMLAIEEVESAGQEAEAADRSVDGDQEAASSGEERDHRPPPQPESVQKQHTKRKHRSSRRSRTARLPPPPVRNIRPMQGPQTAVDPSGIMKRALARDVGDGSAIIEIMKKYRQDTRIQTHGIRALKSVVRKFLYKRNGNQGSGRGDKSEDDSDEEAHQRESDVDEDEIKRREVVELIVDSMKRHQENLSIQRDALFCLLEYTSQADEHVAQITSLGAVVSIMEAMARLPDDEEAQIAALSILGHPTIADESVLRVNPESRRLVLSAMRRFPRSERLQGLGCLSLANLCLRQDESMREIVAQGGLELVVAAMNRFGDVSLIQAAGSWMLSTVSSKDDEMLAACLDAGGLPACEKARVRFLTDPPVQQHAVFAIQNMVRDVPESREDGRGDAAGCSLQ